MLKLNRFHPTKFYKHIFHNNKYLSYLSTSNNNPKDPKKNIIIVLLIGIAIGIYNSGKGGPNASNGYNIPNLESYMLTN